MGMQGMICAKGYQRTTSSGMVFDGKLPANDESENKFPLNGILFTLIEEEMELSFRSRNCLNNAGIKLIGQLVQKSAAQLLDLNNFGRTSLREIEKVLTEMDLTLEMTLDFPPWNGDNNGVELIQILSLQEPDGGFYIDDNTAKALGVDLKEMQQNLPENNSAKNRKKCSLLHTKYLLDLLDTNFEKNMPYLTGLIESYRKWLGKESSKVIL
jgi:hypothetical protein